MTASLDSFRKLAEPNLARHCDALLSTFVFRQDYIGGSPEGAPPCFQHQARAVPRWIRREKKRIRPLEQLRPDVLEKRKAFLRKVRRIPVKRLVFMDESGLNQSMTRSHAWVKKGTEFVQRTPKDWGKNLTLLGALRVTGWVVLSTMFATANKDRFVRWLKRKLLPKLRRRDVLLLDNLPAHEDKRVAPACAHHGVRLLYLPPHSPDFNPIEPSWALQKQHVRRHAPRDPVSLRRIARRARFRVTPRHCRQWFKHAGYRVQPR